MLVLSSEMPGTCVLDSVQLLCGSDEYNHGVFRNAGVYACHTTVNELDSACAENYAGNKPVQVMARDTLNLLWMNGEWQGLAFDGPFTYNGSDNLVLEFRWQGDDGGSVYNLGYYTSGNRAVDARSSTAEYGTPRSYMPRFRIYYSPTGVAEGRLRPTGQRVFIAPNPFTTGTTITMQPAAKGGALVRVFDAGGRLVRILGQSSIVHWDGRDEAGRHVEPGAYFCRLDDGTTARLVRCK